MEATLRLGRKNCLRMTNMKQTPMMSCRVAVVEGEWSAGSRTEWEGGRRQDDSSCSGLIHSSQPSTRKEVRKEVPIHCTTCPPHLQRPAPHRVVPHGPRDAQAARQHGRNHAVGGHHAHSRQPDVAATPLRGAELVEHREGNHAAGLPGAQRKQGHLRQHPAAAAGQDSGNARVGLPGRHARQAAAGHERAAMPCTAVQSPAKRQLPRHGNRCCASPFQAAAAACTRTPHAPAHTPATCPGRRRG